MRYDELKAKVLKQAFPLGAPENLLEQLDDYFRCALIEVQRWIDCYQIRHTNVYPACTTFTQCGTTVLTKPQGSRITRVYTVERAGEANLWCTPIPYNPATMDELRRWMAKTRASCRYLSTSLCDFQVPTPVNGSNCQGAIPGSRGLWCPPGSIGSSSSAFSEGFRPASQECDSPCGRALVGLYAVDMPANRIWIAPWLQWNEAAVIEWHGMKRDWNDADEVPDSPDFIRLCRTWIVAEYNNSFACENAPTSQGMWADALADGIVTCQDEKRAHGAPRSAEEADQTWFMYLPRPPGGDPLPEPVPIQAKVAFFGDFGTNDSNAQAVADQVHAADPDLICTLGDNRYDPLTVETAFLPYAADVADGNLVAALGNHDWDDNDAQPLLAYVKNPGNGRYFSIVVGPVEIFVFDSGINTANQVKEPNGNYAGSQQWSELNTAIARSCSPWKIAVIHHSPYTSAATYSPGVLQFRWASDLLVHAVLAGHGHIYERGVFRNRLHLVAGTGGAPLVDIGTPIEGSQVQLKEFGFVMMEATLDKLSFKFIDSTGTVRDTVEVPQAITMPPITIQPPDDNEALAVPTGEPIQFTGIYLNPT